jgi:signal transduction histidine kinase
MEKAKSAVGICYAYLSAYRNMVNVAGRTSYWSPDSLRAALSESTSLYCDNLEKDVTVCVDSADSFAQIANVYVLAILLPLLENAAEACESGDKIHIVIENHDESFSAKISNPIHGPFPGGEVLQTGFTTKAAHEGLGLSIVQNLLAYTSGASLGWELNDDILTFIITIPHNRVRGVGGVFVQRQAASS